MIIENKVIDEIIQACQSKEPNPIKEFDNFIIDKEIGNGQQGIVFKVRNNIKSFALKFYHPTDKSASILNESIGRFIDEVKFLATLNHKNIVKIYIGGFAYWDNTKKEWSITEGFQNPKTKDIAENEFYYYIMDFIEGYDLTAIYPELADPNDTDKPKSTMTFPILYKLRQFEVLIKQVSKAMDYYHNKGITHKDIKPENIRFSTEDSTFIIVDFGFARHITSPQEIETIPRKRYLDAPSIRTKNYKKNDMGQFCMMLADLLPIFKDEYLINRYSGLESSINKGKNPDLNERYEDIKEFYTHIKQYFLTEGEWRFQLKLDEFMTPNGFGRFDSKLRIPVSGSILLSKELKEVIDTPEFQRLRGVRQLGPTMFVFPGANHTRFEHSLGVYSLSLKYLEKLLSLSEFKIKCEPIEKSIKLIVLSSLLHDIGHYPYSHWIEEIDELPQRIKLPHHEERAIKILQGGEIKSVIENEWDINIDEITDLIANKSDNELINSFINSLIDVDKLDYLKRDSVHCGINYGEGIDIERLFDSLYVNAEANKLCVTEKGRSALLSILSTRNIMYQEVYWHKTVRACEAMFKRFFYEYVAKNAPIWKKESINELEKLFNSSDDEFTAKLNIWAENENDKKLKELIQPFAYGGRKHIYKPAYIFFDRNTKEKSVANTFFRNLFDNSYKEMLEKSKNLSKLIKKYISDVEPLDIILEKTPIKKQGEQYMLDGFKIYNTRKKSYDDHPTEIDIFNNYLTNNRQAYIFCHPRLYDELRKLFLEKEGKTLQSILTQIS